MFAFASSRARHLLYFVMIADLSLTKPTAKDGKVVVSWGDASVQPYSIPSKSGAIRRIHGN